MFSSHWKSWSRVGRWVLCLAWLPFVLACPGEGAQNTLVLGAYTAPREAFREINERFEKEWERRTGESLKIQESYLSSGAQSRAVLDGFAADVVALSLDSDVDRLADAGLIKHPWRRGPTEGYVTESVVAFAVRPGNPKDVNGWQDLLKPGLKILTPNPKTSGGAQWNVLAVYGAALRGAVPGVAASPEAAQKFLTQVLSQVVAMGKGARESILTFERGLGDVALSYENEIKQGQASGQKYEMVIPQSTIRIRNPVALVDRNLERHGNRELAEAYVNYLLSPEAQTILARHGFRSVLPEVQAEFVEQYPKVSDSFGIEYFGGWPAANEKFFGADGIFVKAAEVAQQKR